MFVQHFYTVVNHQYRETGINYTCAIITFNLLNSTTNNSRNGINTSNCTSSAVTLVSSSMPPIIAKAACVPAWVGFTDNGSSTAASPAVRISSAKTTRISSSSRIESISMGREAQAYSTRCPKQQQASKVSDMRGFRVITTKGSQPHEINKHLETPCLNRDALHFVTTTVLINNNTMNTTTTYEYYDDVLLVLYSVVGTTVLLYYCWAAARSTRMHAGSMSRPRDIPRGRTNVHDSNLLGNVNNGNHGPRLRDLEQLHPLRQRLLVRTNAFPGVPQNGCPPSLSAARQYEMSRQLELRHVAYDYPELAVAHQGRRVFPEYVPLPERAGSEHDGGFSDGYYRRLCRCITSSVDNGDVDPRDWPGFTAWVRRSSWTDSYYSSNIRGESLQEIRDRLDRRLFLCEPAETQQHQQHADIESRPLVVIVKTCFWFLIGCFMGISYLIGADEY